MFSTATTEAFLGREQRPRDDVDICKTCHRSLVVCAGKGVNDKAFFNEDKMKITFTQSSRSRPYGNHYQSSCSFRAAQVLIASGQATAAPRPPYGSTAWPRKRKADAARAVPHPEDIDATVKNTEWGVREQLTDPIAKVVVIKRTGAETTFYAEPPSDAPPSIVRRFQELTHSFVHPDAVTARRERPEREQFEQQSVEERECSRQLRKINMTHADAFSKT